MKKLLCLLLTLLLFTFTLSLVSCDEPEVEPKEISCEDIIGAYEDAGYYVVHGDHKDETDSSQLCYIKASISEESNSDYIYFITCFTEEAAKDAARTDEYNLAVWLIACINGESRWLESGTYGKIEYSYYNPDLIKPFRELIK